MAFAEELSRGITCPHCKEKFEATVYYVANVSVTLGSEGHTPDLIREQRGEKVTPITKADGFVAALDPAQKLAWEAAESSGMGQAFANAFQHAHGTIPGNIPKAFFGWLRCAKQKKISAEVMAVLKQEFGGYITFFAHQSVAAVVSDGEIVNFMPCQTVGLAGVGDGFRIGQAGEQLARNTQQWIRTKYGYVAKGGVHLEAMRKKSYGEFCNPIL